MKKREGKVGRIVLILFALGTILLLIVELETQRPVKAPFFEEKIKAGQIFQEAMKIIKTERERRGLLIDKINDPNETGIIGSQYTTITLERSDLSPHLTSTNPNFPAIFIDLFKKLKIKDGDTVAVGLDGSFPAVNLALYSAMRILNIKPVIITTASSAMWGANHPDFTWLDMEQISFKEKMFTFKSIAASLGGEDDLGRGFSPEARTQLIHSIARNQVEFINSEDLDTNIKKRLDYYFAKGRIKLFINIGKSIANMGENRALLSSGIIKNKPKKMSGNSVVQLMIEKKIPVINITDVNKIALRYGLPVAPVPLPVMGKGKLFLENRLSQTLAIIFTFVIIIVLFFVIRYDLEYYLTKKNRRQCEKIKK